MTKTTCIAVLAVAAACAVLACVTRSSAKPPARPLVAAVDGPDLSRESRLEDRWFVRFENPNDVACHVTRYHVVWSDGAKTLEPRQLYVPPHGRVVRSIALPASAVATAQFYVSAVKC